MSSQLIIKAHSPWKTWVKSIFALAIVAGVSWVGFAIGHKKAGYDNEYLAIEQNKLQQKIYELGQVNTELRERHAVLERSTLVDKQANVEMESSMRGLQDEILELKEEVTFYRGIVSPVENASGVGITSLKLVTIGNKNSFRFKLVLTQVKHNDRLIRGIANMYIDGIMHGTHKQLTLAQVTGGSLKNLKLRYKYFQNIEGDIVLPDDFLPSRILIDLQPKGKGLSRIKKTFDWTDISS